ncbi:hypothetical protein Trydic_g21007 [Trypoxylus dichotomus]
MYSLRHGVNLSRRACRNDGGMFLMRLLLLMTFVVGLAAGSPLFATNTRPQPDSQPLPEDYNSNVPYEGVEFGPMGPSRSPQSQDEKPKRYQVASVSFQPVKTPFIIGLWIFCASLAKIGKANKVNKHALTLYLVLFD